MNNDQQKGQGYQKNTQPPPMADKQKDKKKMSGSDKEFDKDSGACGSKGGSCGSSADSDDNEE